MQEMEPPSILNCELRPYQKQALHWMTQLEIGATAEDATRTLHPCWEAYQLAEYVSYFWILCGVINFLFTLYDVIQSCDPVGEYVIFATLNQAGL